VSAVTLVDPSASGGAAWGAQEGRQAHNSESLLAGQTDPG